MAVSKGKTPAQVRDAKIAQLNKAVKAKQITAAEYRQGVNAAKAAFASASKGAAAGRAVSAAGVRAEQGAAALRTAQGLKAPVAAAGRAVRFVAGMPKSPGQAAVQAAIIAGPWAVGKIREAGAKQSKTTVRVPASNVDKAMGAAAGRVTGRAAAKPTTSRVNTQRPADRGRDKGASAAANIVRGTATKPAVSSKSYTVKKGDSLWAIAQANNTTVSALMKANPTLAKRKAAGKTTIFSGSKVRIPKGK